MNVGVSTFRLHSHRIVSKMSYYAVAKGRNVGIYRTWGECKDQVHQFSGAVYKKFSTAAEAEAFISGHKEPVSFGSAPKNKILKTLDGFVSRSSGYTGRLKTSTGTEYYTGRNLSNKLEPNSRILQNKIDIGEQSRNHHKKSSNSVCSSSDSQLSSISDTSNSSDSSSFYTDSEGRVDIYTDGACSGNGTKRARAGIGVFFGDGHPEEGALYASVYLEKIEKKENVSKPVSGRVTNNSAEIEAVIEAAIIARKYKFDKVRICTDSQFLISCIEKWMPKWKRRGWKTASNQPVINKEELIKMEDSLKGLDVEFFHIKGHSGVHGNEMADELARRGAEKCK